jgi:DNA adenine methylase
VRPDLSPPFPWFGGKSRVAHLVWDRFGPVRNYVEPFFGGGAVLLGRPDESKIETVNDKDAYLANFWRALSCDPDEVAKWADSPVNEADLHARHRWLVETAAERMERVKTDPEFFDPKVAGWWVWGQCLWIGSGWCAGDRNKREQRPALCRAVGLLQKRPALTGNGGGKGVHRPLDQKRPALSQGGGRGVTRQLPDLSGDSGAAGRGIHASGFRSRTGGLQTYMRALADRLRRVRVCCGDFERVLGPAATTGIGTTGVFLDPPYPEDGRAICYNHDGAEDATGRSVWWRAYEWALANAADPALRIAICGYEHPDAIFPEEWECIEWKASGGYGRSKRGKANAHRERIWFSPACVRSIESSPLFASLYAPVVSTTSGDRES